MSGKFFAGDTKQQETNSFSEIDTTGQFDVRVVFIEKDFVMKIILLIQDSRRRACYAVMLSNAQIKSVGKIFRW